MSIWSFMLCRYSGLFMQFFIEGQALLLSCVLASNKLAKGCTRGQYHTEGLLRCSHQRAFSSSDVADRGYGWKRPV